MFLSLALVAVDKCVCVGVCFISVKLRKPLFWPHHFCFSMRRVVSFKTLRIQTAINFMRLSPPPFGIVAHCHPLPLGLLHTVTPSTPPLGQWGVCTLLRCPGRSFTCPVLHLLHTYKQMTMAWDL